MKKVRLLVGGILAVLLGGGYVASQYAALTGQASEYAYRVDQPTIVTLSLVLFLAALALFLIPEPEDEPK